MEEKHIRRIKIRRGSDNQRKLVIFEEGEPVFILDKKRVYIGDNVTYGGILVSNKNFVSSLNGIRPQESIIGDLVHDKNDNSTYIINNETTSNLNDNISIFCCGKIEAEVNDIENIINTLSALV